MKDNQTSCHMTVHKRTRAHTPNSSKFTDWLIATSLPAV